MSCREGQRVQAGFDERWQLGNLIGARSNGSQQHRVQRVGERRGVVARRVCKVVCETWQRNAVDLDAQRVCRAKLTFDLFRKGQLDDGRVDG